MSRMRLTREITEPVELRAEDEECANAADSQLNVTSAEQRRKPVDLLAELFQLKKRKEDLQEWNLTIKGKLIKLKSQLRIKGGNENLLAEIRSLKENERILTKKNKHLTANLASVQSFIENKHKKVRELKQNINELDWWVDDTQHDKEVQMEYLRREMEAEINIGQKQLYNLQRREEFLRNQINDVAAVSTHMMNYRHKIQKRSSELKRTSEDLVCEIQGVESLVTKSEKEIKRVDRIMAAKKDQLDGLIGEREIKRLLAQDLEEEPSLLQEEKILADSEEMKNPVEETPPNSGPWFPKYLLVGLGFATGGLLIYSAFRAFSAS